jgi:hypothetical protein
VGIKELLSRKLDQAGEQRPKSAKRKMTWLDWVLLLLAAAIMIWIVEYSMEMLMNL